MDGAPTFLTRAAIVSLLGSPSGSKRDWGAAVRSPRTPLLVFPSADALMECGSRGDDSGFEAFIGFLHCIRVNTTLSPSEPPHAELSDFCYSRAESVRYFDVDLERCKGIAAIKLHLNLVWVEIHVFGYHREDFLADDAQQVGLVAGTALVRQQNLQPLTRDRGRAATPQEVEQVHAALRPNSLSNSPLRSLGTFMARVSPRSRRAASI